MSDEEVPTKPESHDPMMAIVARIESKVDTLTKMVSTFFEELQKEQRLRLELEERVAYLEGMDGA